MPQDQQTPQTVQPEQPRPEKALRERLLAQRQHYETLLSQQRAAREQAEAALREREEQLRAQTLRCQAQQALEARDLPAALVDALQLTDEQTFEQSLNAVEAAFRQSLERGVRDRLRGGAPSMPALPQNSEKKPRMSYQQAASLYASQRTGGDA